MKKWRIIKVISITIIILFLFYIVFDVIKCINMLYPYPMLGIDANNWTDKFFVDLFFIMLLFGIPMIIKIVILIISIFKIKKIKNIEMSKKEDENNIQKN